VTDKDFHGPRPTAQWDSVPAPELARLRRIEAAAEDVCDAYDAVDEIDAPALLEAVEALRDAVAP
jgi:hypothetical protein